MAKKIKKPICVKCSCYNPNGASKPICIHPKNFHPDGNLVTGEPLMLYKSCEELRDGDKSLLAKFVSGRDMEDATKCGAEGKWFIPLEKSNGKS